MDTSTGLFARKPVSMSFKGLINSGHVTTAARRCSLSFSASKRSNAASMAAETGAIWVGGVGNRGGFWARKRDLLEWQECTPSAPIPIVTATESAR